MEGNSWPHRWCSETAWLEAWDLLSVRCKKKEKGHSNTDLETNTATTKLLHGINGDLSLINAGFVGGQL